MMEFRSSPLSNFVIPPHSTSPIEEEVTERVAVKREMSEIPDGDDHRLSKRSKFDSDGEAGTWEGIAPKKEPKYMSVPYDSTYLPKDFTGKESTIYIRNGSVCTDVRQVTNEQFSLESHTMENSRPTNLSFLEDAGFETSSISEKSHPRESSQEVLANLMRRSDPHASKIEASAEICALLREILSEIKDLNRQNRDFNVRMLKMEKNMRKLKIAAEYERAEPIEGIEPVMYEGEDLTQLYASRPSILGLRLANKLFTPEELKTYRLSPAKTLNNGRPAFPEAYKVKIDLLKQTIKKRFPGGWHEAKMSINQRGNDLKKNKN